MTGAKQCARPLVPTRIAAIQPSIAHPHRKRWDRFRNHRGAEQTAGELMCSGRCAAAWTIIS